MKNLFISNSGGETSAYMSNLIMDKYRARYDKIIKVFANTGLENEQTLEFINNCDKKLGFETVWIEAIPSRGRQPVTHKIVTFETASRNAEPFEAAINIYGIPNVAFPLCTRELKTRPMASFIRSLGWKSGDFDVAVGIRADEAERRSKNPGSIIYFLMDVEPTTKPQINQYWRDMPFRLELAGYQGNCKTCWKKSTRKLLTIMDENPGAFDFFERMERENSYVGAEFSKQYIEGYKRSFFRNHLTVADLRKMMTETEWARADNDAVIYHDEIQSLDLDAGCVDSCEVDFNELQMELPL